MIIEIWIETKDEVKTLLAVARKRLFRSDFSQFVAAFIIIVAGVLLLVFSMMNLIEINTTEYESLVRMNERCNLQEEIDAALENNRITAFEFEVITWDCNTVRANDAKAKLRGEN